MTAGRDFQVGEPEGEGAHVRFAVSVPADLRYLEGHFPGRPIVPGVAQLVLVERAIRRAWPELGPPRAVRRLKFTQALGPGDALVLTLARSGPDIRFTITRDDVECSRGVLGYR